jgi:hypothetical protein
VAPIPDIRDLLTYFAAEVMQFTIEYIGKIFGGFTPLSKEQILTKVCNSSLFSVLITYIS